MGKPIVNIADLVLESWNRGEMYAGADNSFGQALGLTGLGTRYNEVPAGKSSCPFHVHHAIDEMFFILDGTGEYRFGSAVYPVKAGDVLAAPAGGAERAHQLINTGSTILSYLGISSRAPADVVEYPDSGKFLVSSPRPGTEGRLRFVGRPEASIDYWDGEPGADAPQAVEQI